MGEVVDILKNTPHIEGDVTCLNCNHEWQGVAPVGTTSLECPECKLFKGVFVSLPVPEIVYQCACGSKFYFIEPD